MSCRKESVADHSVGPVLPGSTLHRLLTMVARRVAGRIVNKPEPSAAAEPSPPKSARTKPD